MLMSKREESRLNECSTTEEPAWLRIVKGISLPEKLANLRQKLYRKAKQEPSFRFYTLYDRIYRRDTLHAAFQLVHENKGAPGLDGVTFDDILSSDDSLDRFLDDIQEALRTKSYRPQPVKRVYIPKPNGTMRPLSIPTIRDRVVQMAVVLILEPIFEADFLDSSYGFRPGKSAHQALDEIRSHLKSGFTAVYDADLKGYFDSIPHDKLMACLRKRIVDKSVLKLIRMWLTVKVKEEGKPPYRPRKGTPQGGVISPLLANIYLHWFDKVFHMKNGPACFANAKLVRYADDFVIMARYQGEVLGDWIEEKLEVWLGLKINREKTRTVEVHEEGESLDFLGFTFRYDRDLHGGKHRYLNVVPSKKSLLRERDKLREMTSRRWNFMGTLLLTAKLNRHLKGWGNYFRYGYPSRAFHQINWYAMQRFASHLRRRSQRPFKPPKGETMYQHIKKLGLISLK